MYFTSTFVIISAWKADSVDEVYNLNNFDFYSKLTWTGYSDAHNWNLENGRDRDETEQDSNNDWWNGYGCKGTRSMSVNNSFRFIFNVVIDIFFARKTMWNNLKSTGNSKVLIHFNNDRTHISLEISSIRVVAAAEHKFWLSKFQDSIARNWFKPSVWELVNALPRYRTQSPWSMKREKLFPFNFSRFFFQRGASATTTPLNIGRKIWYCYRNQEREHPIFYKSV